MNIFEKVEILLNILLTTANIPIVLNMRNKREVSFLLYLSLRCIFLYQQSLPTLKMSLFLQRQFCL